MSGEAVPCFVHGTIRTMEPMGSGWGESAPLTHARLVDSVPSAVFKKARFLSCGKNRRWDAAAGNHGLSRAF